MGGGGGQGGADIGHHFVYGVGFHTYPLPAVCSLYVYMSFTLHIDSNAAKEAQLLRCYISSWYHGSIYTRYSFSLGRCMYLPPYIYLYLLWAVVI